ncbi:MAG: very short patch repair endonuclease [Candidatus Acidiferrales bacterium]
MPDRIDAATRSKIMSRIRKKWSQIDRKIHNILKSAKIRHSMYPKLAGSPDVLVYPDILVFLDGCFWHCCPKCFRLPKSRLNYWRPKLVGNKQRDVKISRLLRKQGWKVVRIWEHEIRSKPTGILRQLDKLHSEKPIRRLVALHRSSIGAPKLIRRQ